MDTFDVVVSNDTHHRRLRAALLTGSREHAPVLAHPSCTALSSHRGILYSSGEVNRGENHFDNCTPASAGLTFIASQRIAEKAS